MLGELIKNIAPAQIAAVVKENPFLTISVLQNFKTFQLLADALTVDQQMTISQHLPKLEGFLSSKEGKTAVGIFAEEFTEYVESCQALELHNTI